jgi:L-ascorbate metabolism protein UlaG (beta-lactamase superfamily)
MLDVTWLGHSTIQLTTATGEVILIDPWLDGNPKYPTGHTVNRCDAILLSHAHEDHLGATIDLAKRFPSAKIGCMYELYCYLETKGVTTAIGMNKGGTLDLGFARATMVNAFHSSSVNEGGVRVYAGEPAGWALDIAGKKIYFAGDTCVFGDMRIIAELYGPLDVAILPIGDLYTMGPREAAYAARLLRPKQILPIHWGTFPPLTGTPDALAELIQDLRGTAVARLQPGNALRLA